MEEYRNVYGLDYASKVDYFGVVLNQIPPFKPDEPNVPRLKTLRNYSKLDYADMLELLEKELFRNYAPTYIVADYTNEKTFTDMLVRDYGEDRVEPIVFSIPNKTMLKQDGRSIMRQGYKWPNPAQVKNPTLRAWIMTTIAQLKREQIITTGANNITFDHPPGEHKDLAIAWELSIHGCLRLALRPNGNPVIKSKSVGPSKRGYPRPRDMINEITKNGNNRITGLSVSGM